MAGKAWTPEEDGHLQEWNAEGVDLHEQARRLNRGFESVAGRRRRLNLRFDTPADIADSKPEEKSIVDDVWIKIKSGKQKYQIVQLADEFNVAPKEVRKAIDAIKSTGRLVFEEDGHVWTGTPLSGGVTVLDQKDTIDISQYTDGCRVLKFGVSSDQHICSKYARIDVLNALYDIFEKEGIKEVYNCGNWVDGDGKYNQNDLIKHGMGEQFKYLVEVYPQREGITTYMIGGDDHEGWWVQREHVDLGIQLKGYCDKVGREDLVYLGYMEHDIVIPAPIPGKKTTIRLLHPGGGSAYALSYAPQKLIESLSGGEKPNIMLIGHYHKAEYLYYRNIHCIQAGTTMDQSVFMRKLKLAAHVGGWICEAHIADDGSVRRFKAEFINFFDKGYYEKEWEHKLYVSDAINA